MKLINIELPCCNRDNALFRYLLKGIHFLTPIKDLLDFSIVFNGEITNKEIEECLTLLNSLDFNVYWTKNTYSFEEGRHGILRIREDAHKLNPNNLPFSLLIDDDIELLNSEYARELVASIYWMIKNPKIGSITLNRRDIRPSKTVYPMNMTFHCWTHGGILLRNIIEWKGLVPPKCQELFGCLEDVLMSYERIKAGYEIYGVYSTSFKHYEHRYEENYMSGHNYHKWNFDFGASGSTVEYLKSHKVDGHGKFPEEIWLYDRYWLDKTNVFDFSNFSIEELKEKAEAESIRRICNIELATCDKDSLLKNFLPTVDKIMPLSPYSTFCINFQKDYSEEDMREICYKLRRLGFEVKSIYSIYKNPYWNLFREDTHKISSNCQIIFSIDDDVIFKTEDISRQYLMAIYKLLSDSRAGVVGIETAAYHRSKGSRAKDTLYPASFQHSFSTDIGLFLRNIPKWNGIVKEELQVKNGAHHDVFVAFERMINGYKGYYIHTNEARLDEDKEYSLDRYDWRKTMEELTSIETYLKRYSPQISYFDNSLWMGEPYWELEKPISFSEYSISDLQREIDKLLLKEVANFV